MILPECIKEGKFLISIILYFCTWDSMMLNFTVRPKQNQDCLDQFCFRRFNIGPSRYQLIPIWPMIFFNHLV